MQLLEKLSSLEFLEYEAWAGLNKSNPESYGLSEETVAEFKSQIQSRLISIREQLLKGTYKFSPTRASVIPKDNGKFRPLQIPEIQDRVVLKGLAIILEQELKPLLKSSEGYSFAYQKKIGVRDAVKQMKEYYDNGYKYIFEADIVNFFPTVDRGSLLKKIFKYLPDDSLNKLIEEGISQPVGGLENIRNEYHSLFDKNNANGIPQGNPLSPLFSNLYLAPFDLEMKNRNLSLIRYADDFIVMCKDYESAFLAYQFSKDYLENILNLKVHELGSELTSKTRIVQPNQTPFSFLSVGFDGSKLFPSRKSIDKFIANISKICNSESTLTSVYFILFKLKFSVEGWVSTYFYTDLERYFEEIEITINQQLFFALKKLGWPLSSKSLSKVKAAYRKRINGKLDSGDCLSDIQRKNSGVPFCKDVLKERLKNNDQKIK
jgi:group II intron reverse transcriptase/maturase